MSDPPSGALIPFWEKEEYANARATPEDERRILAETGEMGGVFQVITGERASKRRRSLNPLDEKFDIARLLADGIPPVEWHGAPGFSPKGHQIQLIAGSESGKSILQLDLAVQLAAGMTPLGLDVPPGDTITEGPIRVLYIDLENPRRLSVQRVGRIVTDLNRRLTEQGRDELDLAKLIDPRDARRGGLFYRPFPDIGALNDQGGAQMLVDFMERRNINYLMVDTLSKAVVGNENDSQTYTDLAAYVLTYLRDQAATSIWGDHTGHDKTRARGSSAKRDNFDGAWAVTSVTRDRLTPGVATLFLSSQSEHGGKNRTGDLPKALRITRHGKPSFEYIRHQFDFENMPDTGDEPTEEMVAGAREPMALKKTRLRTLLGENEDHVRGLGTVNKIRTWARGQGVGFNVVKMNEVITDFLTPIGMD
ncbi:AAA family ATPase [Mycobacteroides abscessus]|uniref:AAA family ATPase n=1 Tax=Mycobacteroides abscessus TaxID=36809 RepID=UPI0009A89CDE|nr:AAA family ATPase [Mycobacteroides abscessus]SLJ09412.1 Uncharacterised protein [Mycobacteroides abscessus subsp. abscessus]